MSESLELEIKSLLDQSGQPTVVAEKIVAMVEHSGDEFQTRDVVTVSRFLLQTNQFLLLIDFVLRHFRKKTFPIPWPYFLEAIHRSRKISAPLAQALLEGIELTNGRTEASVSTALDSHSDILKTERQELRSKAAMNLQRDKQKLLDQLATLRTQQLYQREKELLHKLRRMYPGDADISREMQAHQQRYALEILSRHGHLTPRPYEFKDDDETLKKPLEIFNGAAQEIAGEHKDMSVDLAVAAAMVGDFELGLELLGKASVHTVDMQWLRLELLLGARRFLELLNELVGMEHSQASDPETFFATAYLRAQALWGLGQRHQAVEILESLLASRPQYRSGPALLALWRGP